MVFFIAKKELHANLISLRFTTGSAILLALVALFTFVLKDKYTACHDSYSQLVKQNSEELKGLMTWQNLRPTVYRMPEPLSVFSTGLGGEQIESAEVSISSVPSPGSWFSDSNPLLAIFQDLDISTIFQLVVTMLVLLLVYDSISGEKERRTLALALSQGGSRHQVLLGKLLGCMASIAVPVSLGFLISTLVIQVSPDIDLSVGDWLRVLPMYAASLILAAVFCCLGLLVSALTLRASDTLILLFFLWVLSVVVIPVWAGSLAERFFPLQPVESVEQSIQELDNNLNAKLEIMEKQLWAAGGSVSDDNEPWGYFHRYADRRRILSELNQLAVSEPMKAAAAEQKWQVRQKYLDDLKRQKRIADMIALISPVKGYELVMSGLARNGMRSQENFYEQARQYRRQLLDYLRDTMAFSSLKYITTATDEELVDSRNNDEYFARREAVFAHPVKPLDLSSMPRFVEQPESLSDCLVRQMPHLVLLVTMALIFYFCAYIAFCKYDVR